METSISVETLIYLAMETGVIIPSKLTKFVPLAESVNGVAKHRLAYSTVGEVSLDQLTKQYNKGKAHFPDNYRPTEVEYKKLLGEYLLEQINLAAYKADISYDEMMECVNAVHSFVTANTELLGTGGQIDFLNDKIEVPKDFMRKTTIPYIDELLGGLPQGVTILGMDTGEGKSHLSAQMLLQMIANHKATGMDEGWFFSTEMTHTEMQNMLAPSQQHYKKRLKKAKNIIFDINPLDLVALRDKCVENPNPNRILVIDSIDNAVSNFSDKDKLAAYENFMYMVSRLREADIEGEKVLLNRYIVVTSQVVRGMPKSQHRLPGKHHLNGSSQKERYAGTVFIGWQGDKSDKTSHLVHMTCPKIRHGAVQNPANYTVTSVDYQNLEAHSIINGGSDDDFIL